LPGYVRDQDSGYDAFFTGNAAGSGAQMALVSRPARKIAEQLARKIQYLEIAHQAEFQMVFSDCLLFPEK